jgi:2-methylisocitrate lyase-like PEP mutase family enzyme
MTFKTTQLEVAVDSLPYATKVQRFLDMHNGPGVLVLPNAWDVASAVLFEKAGFKAIATSSAGVSWCNGYADGEHIPQNLMLEVAEKIVSRVSIPVTVDLEAGYGREPKHVAETVKKAIAIGAVGCNIEDGAKYDQRDEGKSLFDFELAVDRIRAGREAADHAGIPFVLNARVDAIYRNRMGMSAQSIAESIRRANAYAEAGARCVFVFPVFDRETIGLLAKEIHAPLNVLVGPGMPTVPELATLGVRRTTFGAGLSRIAWSSAIKTAKLALDRGEFDLSASTLSNQDLNEAFNL